LKYATNGDDLMGDEEDLRERDEELRMDKIEQAKWYESLNLLAEALKIFKSVGDTDNEMRLKRKMVAQYGKKASELESGGRYQDAANLYYLIGETEAVDRMKKYDPDLVIMYDEDAGGIAQLASYIYAGGETVAEGDSFFKPNVNLNASEDSVIDDMKESDAEKKSLPVKMPRKNPMRFCPYCGESILTKKEPSFCPYCGEEL
jgi:hypothetical protein